jgi:hypothetical protein
MQQVDTPLAGVVQPVDDSEQSEGMQQVDTSLAGVVQPVDDSGPSEGMQQVDTALPGVVQPADVSGPSEGMQQVDTALPGVVQLVDDSGPSEGMQQVDTLLAGVVQPVDDSGPSEGMQQVDTPLAGVVQPVDDSEQSEGMQQVDTALPGVVQPVDDSEQSEGMQQVDIPVPALAYGREAWKKHIGDVGEEPSLPNDITAVLDGSCPFFPNYRVKDQHLLVLIPATVNGSPFTLDLLEKLISQYSQNVGHKTRYLTYDKEIKGQFGTIASSSSYWMLMTRDVLPNSRGCTDTAQSSCVKRYATKTGLPYKLPTALEAATAIFTHYTHTRTCLSPGRPLTITYTCCQEALPHQNGARRTVHVGNFTSDSLMIAGFFTGCSMQASTLPSVGVAVCRQL